MLASNGPHRAFRHCGGDILDHAKPVAALRARELYEIFLGLAEACLDARDLAGAHHCAWTAMDLAIALRASAAWRRASSAFE